jgi:hypothetical protein
MIRKQSKSETTTTRANRSIYTKLGAFAQLRLSRGQGTEVIRKSVLPFSILGPWPNSGKTDQVENLANKYFYFLSLSNVVRLGPEYASTTL